MSEELHDHDRGLSFDLSVLMERRHLFKLVAGTGLAVVAAGCASESTASPATTTATTSPAATSPVTTTSPAVTPWAAPTSTAGTATTSGATPAAAVPEETAGPYPGDGSNGVNILQQSGVVRSDITSSFGSSTTVAAGVPITVQLGLVNAATGARLAGAAVYIWHCDANGLYSMYSQGATNENYLRGVQQAGDDGVVTFTSIFPGCYAGRWPQIHYEVYPSLDAATSSASKIATSQLALAKQASSAAYATGGYPSSTQNLSQVSLATDIVFADGADLETPTITGDATNGYTVTMTAAINV